MGVLLTFLDFITIFCLMLKNLVLVTFIYIILLYIDNYFKITLWLNIKVMLNKMIIKWFEFLVFFFFLSLRYFIKYIQPNQLKGYLKQFFFMWLSHQLKYWFTVTLCFWILYTCFTYHPPPPCPHLKT